MVHSHARPRSLCRAACRRPAGGLTHSVLPFVDGVRPVVAEPVYLFREAVSQAVWNKVVASAVRVASGPGLQGRKVGERRRAAPSPGDLATPDRMVLAVLPAPAPLGPRLGVETYGIGDTPPRRERNATWVAVTDVLDAEDRVVMTAGTELAPTASDFLGVSKGVVHCDGREVFVVKLATRDVASFCPLVRLDLVPAAAEPAVQPQVAAALVGNGGKAAAATDEDEGDMRVLSIEYATAPDSANLVRRWKPCKRTTFKTGLRKVCAR